MARAFILLQYGCNADCLVACQPSVGIVAELAAQRAAGQKEDITDAGAVYDAEAFDGMIKSVQKKSPAYNAS